MLWLNVDVDHCIEVRLKKKEVEQKGQKSWIYSAGLVCRLEKDSTGKLSPFSYKYVKKSTVQVTGAITDDGTVSAKMAMAAMMMAFVSVMAVLSA